jgi:YidC/Oxa1 family membrane protein insertase
MDKKNTTIGVTLLIAAFAMMFFTSKMSPPSPAQRTREISQSSGPNQASPVSSSPTSPRDAKLSSAPKPPAEPKTYELSNDTIRVGFSNLGGAIKYVALVAPHKTGSQDKKYAFTLKDLTSPYIINELAIDPALAINLDGLNRFTPYELVKRSSTEIVFSAVYEGRIEVTRRYTLTPGSGDATKDPYQIRYETEFRNLRDQTESLPSYALNVGTAAPLNSEDSGLYQSNGYHIGGKTDFVKRGAFEPGFLSRFGVGSPEPLSRIKTGGSILWASSQNQFFASILTPDQPASQMLSHKEQLAAFHGSSQPAIGVKGELVFEPVSLAPRAEAKTGGLFYAGPKEHARLSNVDIFKLAQDDVMDFGFFSFFSKILLTLMTWVHKLTPDWGIAIIITTLILKIVFLPLTLSASKSAKRMAKIQPEMTALREKYKDDPKKMQEQTMELFKKHKVNPMGGCFPILITIPFFIGFFSMLQSTAEFRFQSFLWASDLSAPDTLGHLFGIPINIMPVLMGATMVIQMQLTPSPTVDNAQAKMMKFMPYFFALLCYNFSCALSLYSTVNGLFTIGQQLVINRMHLKDDDVAVEVAKGGKRPVKNVTPKK